MLIHFNHAIVSLRLFNTSRLNTAGSKRADGRVRTFACWNISLFRDICSGRAGEKRNKPRSVPTNPIDIQSRRFRRGKQFSEKETVRSFAISEMYEGFQADSWIISVCSRMLRITSIARKCLISPAEPLSVEKSYNVAPLRGGVNTNDRNNTCHVIRGFMCHICDPITSTLHPRRS